jgi:CDP-diacylglycerol--serine O-phosphatidyltransferase
MTDDTDAPRENGRDTPRLRKRLKAYRDHRRERREQKPKRPIRRNAVPSFFTLMNLFSGFLALTQVFRGEFVSASWLIALAAFFDVLDGMMARLTDSVSPFGVELDSLCDIVSFGVAPAFLVYAFALHELEVLGALVAALPAVCGAVRLARYNVSFEGKKDDYFEGMPIPGQAMFVIALVLSLSEPSWFSRLWESDISLLVPSIVVLAGLMVSNIPFDALPKPKADYIRKHPRKSLAFAAAGLLIVLLQQQGLLLVLVTYALVGLGRAAHTIYTGIMNVPVTPADERRGDDWMKGGGEEWASE